MISPSSPPVDFPPVPKEDAMCVSVVREDTASFMALCKHHVRKGLQSNRTNILNIKSK